MATNRDRLQDVQPEHHNLSDRERDIVLSLADTVMPEGVHLPGGGNPRTVARFDAFLSTLNPAAVSALKVFLWTLQTAAVARYLRPFTALSRERRTAFLDAWMRADPARRLALRLATMPLKVVHFNDPELFQKIGCVWKPDPAVSEKARWRSQIVLGEELDADAELEAEVVVIGTGAGGAVVARELAAQGHAVLMLEEGRFYDRADFTRRDRLELNRTMYRGGGILPAIGNSSIAIIVGNTVGGSTTVNSGTCFRTPDKVLDQWRTELGLRDFTPAHMAPFFDRVEATIGVQEAKWEHLGGVAEVVRQGAESLGYSHHPLRRNAPECDGQGFCCFGCPTDAKRSTNVSYVPPALQSGATLVAGVRVSRIQVEDGRAVGVEAEVDGRRRLRVKAQYVVLAGGTIYTPLMLLESGLCNRFDQVGRYLSIHPALGLNALFDHEIKGWKGVPQGYCIDEFKDDGIMFEGAFVPLEMATMAFPVIGDEFMEAMEAYNRLATFGFMISDTSRGRVRRTRGGAPLITYSLNALDMERLRRGSAILSRVFFAAGARRVYAAISGHEIIDGEADVQRLEKSRVKPWDLELSAYHPLGTCRMGADPRTSIVDGRHETHEVRNLFVVDGSAVPGALGVNPQVTIMALATRFAGLLDERMRAELH